MAQSSRSSSTTEQKNDRVVLCHYNLPAKISQAWTEKNPGRRFYSCRGRKIGNGYESCKYFDWFDVEKPHGWQHLALFEARDVMNKQKELKSLKNIISSLQNEGGSVEMKLPSEVSDDLKKTREECEVLKR